MNQKGKRELRAALPLSVYSLLRNEAVSLTDGLRYFFPLFSLKIPLRFDQITTTANECTGSSVSVQIRGSREEPQLVSSLPSDLGVGCQDVAASTVDDQGICGVHEADLLSHVSSCQGATELAVDRSVRVAHVRVRVRVVLTQDGRGV